MKLGFDRFYVAGQSPKALVANDSNTVIDVQIWSSHLDESGTDETTITYVSFEKEQCTISKGTPLPEGGTILRLRMSPGQVLYGVSDDIGRGGIFIEPALER